MGARLQWHFVKFLAQNRAARLSLFFCATGIVIVKLAREVHVMTEPSSDSIRSSLSSSDSLLGSAEEDQYVLSSV
jgi:hypothetical protein